MLSLIGTGNGSLPGLLEVRVTSVQLLPGDLNCQLHRSRVKGDISTYDDADDSTWVAND
jgi:hypothetical protein